MEDLLGPADFASICELSCLEGLTISAYDMAADNAEVGPTLYQVSSHGVGGISQAEVLAVFGTLLTASQVPW
jgi:hypothetical protein